MLFRSRKQDEAGFLSARMKMVSTQIEKRGVRDKRVLDAMRKIPRHLFLPERLRSDAYADHALPIDQGQTISQPYIVASMTEELQITQDSKVLEIGTGSGYQTAVLAEIASHVYSIEYLESLSAVARAKLTELGYRNVTFRHGDGNLGWNEYAPFDAVIVTAAAMSVPQRLLQQLKESGRMIIPLEEISSGRQNLVRIVRTQHGPQQEVLYAVRFVPLVGSDPE